MHGSACLLSCVIPTYNRRDLTLRAIASILQQDGADRIQIIVVDDGSTDKTGEAVNQHYGADSRVLLLSSSRRHASAARNLGFAHARGEFVCFLDSDDYWLPKSLANVSAVFAAYPDLAFVSMDGSTIATAEQLPITRIVAGDCPGWSHAEFRQARLFSERFDLVDESASTGLLRGDFLPAIIYGDLFYLSGLVIRRECIERAGPFNERFRFFNDWEFFARLCLQGPGAYLDYDGFRRDSGREDQISRNRPSTAMARRHLFILRSLLRRGDTSAVKHARRIRQALDDACYGMARSLAGSTHRRWRKLYLYRCIQHRYKLFRCLFLLAIGATPTRS